MPVNLAAAAVLASSFWAISAWTILTRDGPAPQEFWTVTSSDNNPSRPTLARASLPRSLASARATYVARLDGAPLSSN